jgi:quercetin dioxygenase-like cupin family protein
LGALGEHALSAQKITVSRVELINADLAEFPGTEACLYTVELAPGAITPRHRHPGHYFSYVLEITDKDKSGTVFDRP